MLTTRAALARSPRPIALALTALLLAPVTASAETKASYLTDPDLYARALTQLTSRLEPNAKLKTLTVERERMVAEVQGGSPNHVDAIEVQLLRNVLFDRDVISGPRAIQPSGPGRDVASSFFPLADADLAALPKLIEDALDRAALEDRGAPVSATLARRFAVLPHPSYAEPRWTISVASARERATIAANLRGEIVSTDLSGTNRLRGLDFLNRNDAPYAQAQAKLREALGSGKTVQEIEVSVLTINADAVLPAGAPKAEKLIWDPSRGLRVDRMLAAMGIDMASLPGRTRPAFSFDEVDLGKLPGLRAAARQALSMPEGRVTSMRAEVLTQLPRPELRWKVVVRDTTGESGSVTASMAGEIRSVELPEGRRKAVDRLAADQVVAALAEAREAFGDDAKVASILVDERGLRVVLDNPARPGTGLQYISGPAGLTQFGAPLPHFPGTVLFRLADTKAISVDEIARYQARTLEQVKIPGAAVFRVTVDRRVLPGRGDRTLAVEVRAGIERGDVGGRVVFAQGGRELEVIRP